MKDGAYDFITKPFRARAAPQASSARRWSAAR